METKIVNAIIRWICRENGGRVHPPSGPIYYATCYFDAPVASRGINGWSVVLEFPESLNQPIMTKGTIRFLVDEAPHHLLKPGTQFEVYEGRKVVAVIEVMQKMIKTLKVMADYQCSPLWIRDVDGLRNTHPNELLLSTDLVNKLMAWATEYDMTLKWDDPASSGFRTQSIHESFVQRGRWLAEEIANQINGDLKVIYFDDIAQREIVIIVGHE